MVKDHCDSERGNSFRLAARVLLYALSHRQESTYHCLYYTSCGALAGRRNSSMGPPWRIDPTTHHTMSECSYHRATSHSTWKVKSQISSFYSKEKYTIYQFDCYIKRCKPKSFLINSSSCNQMRLNNIVNKADSCFITISNRSTYRFEAVFVLCSSVTECDSFHVNQDCVWLCMESLHGYSLTVSILCRGITSDSCTYRHCNIALQMKYL